ncbi:MAG: segregation and condensation protein A [Micavibrio sp.]
MMKSAVMIDDEVTDIPFEEDAPREGLPEGQHHADELLLNIDGYEGPIEVLLMMARDQKVDLSKISILQLVRQYLAFVDRAAQLRLDLAAEYLVMAAWLAYLKSRLLLPRENNQGDGPTAEQMAEALQFQLRRLEAMQNAAKRLFALPQLGNGIYARGMPEGLTTKTNVTWDFSLFDLLKAYGDIKRRQDHSTYELPTFSIMSLQDALERVGKMLGALPRKGTHSVWITLQSLIPEKMRDVLLSRSSMASMFTAGLELVKQGKAEIRQDGAFRPIYMRASYVERDAVVTEESANSDEPSQNDDNKDNDDEAVGV